MQGLFRDLAKLRATRAIAQSGAAPRNTCVCAESTLGLTAIFAGVLLEFVTSPVVIRVPWFACRRWRPP